MHNMKKAKIIQNSVVFVALVLFVVVTISAFGAGKKAAISNVILQNANQMALGFNYFKQDQDRFPSEFEYSNHDLMSIYFNVFPPANIPTANCPNNFTYKADNSKTYNLNFCLPRAVGSYIVGWNKISPPPSLE